MANRNDPYRGQDYGYDGHNALRYQQRLERHAQQVFHDAPAGEDDGRR